MCIRTAERRKANTKKILQSVAMPIDNRVLERTGIEVLMIPEHC